MRKILGVLVVLALLLGSGSVLAAPALNSKALEVRQAVDRANEGPSFIRAAMERLIRSWDSIAKAVGGTDREVATQTVIASGDELERQNPRHEEEIRIGSTSLTAVGGTD